METIFWAEEQLSVFLYHDLLKWQKVEFETAHILKPLLRLEKVTLDGYEALPKSCLNNLNQGENPERETVSVRWNPRNCHKLWLNSRIRNSPSLYHDVTSAFHKHTCPCLPKAPKDSRLQ